MKVNKTSLVSNMEWYGYGKLRSTCFCKRGNLDLTPFGCCSCSLLLSCAQLLWPLWTVCCPPGSSVHGLSQVRILKQVAISFSRGSSRPKDWTCVSCIGRQESHPWATREATFDCYHVQSRVVDFSDFKRWWKYLTFFQVKCSVSQDSAGQMKFVLNLFIILHGHDLQSSSSILFHRRRKAGFSIIYY